MSHLLELGILLFFAQVFCTFALTGIIWLVQIVHYPLFAFAEGARWGELHRAHSFRISWIVAPLMLVELAAAVYFFSFPLGFMTRTEKDLAAVLVVLIWFSTFALQVPQHNILGSGFNANSHRRLVRTNWLRTICWSAGSVIVMMWLCRAAIHPVS